MTTSRERVIQALSFEPVDRIPRELWIPPEAHTRRDDELQELQYRFPCDFCRPSNCYPPGKRTKGSRSKPGPYTDAWGCMWAVSHTDGKAELMRAPLCSRKAMEEYTPPWEVVDKLDTGSIGRVATQTTCFVLPWTEIGLLRRLAALLGWEPLIDGLRNKQAAVLKLLDTVDSYFQKEVARWAESSADGILLSDDWANHTGTTLPVSVWRKYVLPCYTRYIETLQAADKFVFLHVPGNIAKIVPDLVDAGLDCLSTDFAGWDVAEAAAQWGGKLAFWAGPSADDLSAGDPPPAREAIRRLSSAFRAQDGGFIAYLPWRESVSFYSLCAAFDELAFATSSGIR